MINKFQEETWQEQPTPESVTERYVHPAVAQLTQDLKQKNPFELGTVIRWVSVAVNGSRFHYAAIYAMNKWYTTLSRDNNNLQKQMTHEELISYFNEHGYSIQDLAVATEFQTIELA